MDASTAWENLSDAIAAMQRPEGDYELKVGTVTAGVELLFEFPSDQILAQVEQSGLPVRALVSWLVFEGGRLAGVDPSSVSALRELYESTCPEGEGIIPPPRAEARIVPS
jgi:hypothetical protein